MSKSETSHHSSSVRIDLGYLRALDADATHQSLLIEDESVNTTLERRRGKILAKALVQDDKGWPGSQFPAVTVVEILKRCIVHKKQAVAKGLNPGLKAKGARERSIIAYCPTFFAQGAIAILRGEEEATLDDIREDQDPPCLVPQILRSRRTAVKHLQSRGDIAVD